LGNFGVQAFDKINDIGWHLFSGGFGGGGGGGREQINHPNEILAKILRCATDCWRNGKLLLPGKQDVGLCLGYKKVKKEKRFLRTEGRGKIVKATLVEGNLGCLGKGEYCWVEGLQQGTCF
jgi:hypothetical protein